jgi:TrmH family RNA methyltransferase
VAKVSTLLTRSFTESIFSDGNAKYKLMKSLQLKKYRLKEQLVLVEGQRSVLDAVTGGLSPKIVLATSNAFDQPLGNKLLSAIRPFNCLDIVSESLMKGLTETVQSQGICAAFSMPSQPLELPKNATLIVISDGVSDPGNLGTILRTSFGLGVDAIVMTGGSCDPYSSKVIRASMGTALSPLLPIFQFNWREIKERLHDSNFNFLVADASGQAYDEIDMRHPSVIVVGSEATGVSDEALQQSRLIKICIPMSRGLESLNVGVASSIILGEAARQRRSTS